MEKDICSLARCYEDGIGCERLHVDCIYVYDGQAVVGNAEEELVVEISVDEAEKIGFAWLYLEPECVCILAINKLLEN